LSNGVSVVIDSADLPLIAPYRWHAHAPRGIWYAYRHARTTDGRGTTQMMHTLLTGWPLVDHRNGNGMDNRRANLRQASVRENAQNMRAKSGTSLFKGVSWLNRDRQWRVQIRVVGRRIHVGQFNDETDAARAYDAAARIHHGPFAALNFPLPGERGAL
jgi:hypothetical protein